MAEKKLTLKEKYQLMTRGLDWETTYQPMDKVFPNASHASSRHSGLLDLTSSFLRVRPYGSPSGFCLGKANRFAVADGEIGAVQDVRIGFQVVGSAVV